VQTRASAYTDSQGRTLEDYKRPSVAVDTALLTVTPHDGLSVLLARRHGAAGGEEWALPGTFLHEGETLIDAVQRSLREKAGIEGVSPRQLRVFDAPGRDSRGWVLSVAHVDVVPTARLAGRDPERTRLVSAGQAGGGLPFEHDDIIKTAVGEVRAQYDVRPDPYGLLPEPFTILDLRMLHEVVADGQRQRDTFRRRMMPHLTATGEVRDGARGRPAELFRHAD
jgi:8-oxo-dGTP diphosphatase